MHKCKMENIWCQSSCTEDGCKLSKSQKCPAAVKKGMLVEINRTAAYKAHEGLLLLWPQGGKSSAVGNTQSHLQHCSTNQPAGRAGARSRALGGAGQELMVHHIWEVFTYFKTAATRRLTCSWQLQRKKQWVCTQKTSFRLVLVKYIPVVVLRYWTRPWNLLY